MKLLRRLIAAITLFSNYCIGKNFRVFGLPKLFFWWRDYTNKNLSVGKYCVSILLLLVTVCAQGASEEYVTDRCSARSRADAPPRYDTIFTQDAQPGFSNESEIVDSSSDVAGPARIPDDFEDSYASSGESISSGPKDLIDEENKFLQELEKGATVQECSKFLLEAVIGSKAQRIPVLLAAGATSDLALADYLKYRNKMLGTRYKNAGEGPYYYFNKQDQDYFQELRCRPNIKNRMWHPDYSLTLLSVAVLNNNKDAVEELLLDKGLKIEDLSLIQSIQDGACHAILELLVNAKANVNEVIFKQTALVRYDKLQEQDVRLTPLLLATYNGDVEATQMLIDEGAKIYFEDSRSDAKAASRVERKTVSCCFFCYHVDVEEVPAMIDFTSDFEAAFKHGLEKNKRNVVKAALVAGVNVDLKYADGATPLLSEIRNVNGPMITVLLDGKADVNKEYSGGETALLEATRRGNVEIAQQLLAANAVVDVTNKEGETPIDIADKMHNEAMVRLLREAGAVAL